MRLRVAKLNVIDKTRLSNRLMLTAADVSVAAVAGILLLGLWNNLSVTNYLSIFILLLLMLSIVLFGISLFAESKIESHNNFLSIPKVNNAKFSLISFFINDFGFTSIFLINLVSTQFWFAGGDSISGGDLSPPNGMAWISKLFSPVVWNGVNLGGPGNYEVALPWATLIKFVVFMGGSEGLAERIWCSGSFVIAGIATYYLIRLIGFNKLGAFFGAFFYCFNPFVLSAIGTNPLYLVALSLVPVVLLLVLLPIVRDISLFRSVFFLTLLTPFLGYTFQNPPLTMMIFGVLVFSPIIFTFIFGLNSSRKSVHAVLIAIPIILLLSSYWIIPSFITNKTAAVTSISQLSGWTWTQVRAIFANALWLNTSWAWSIKGYYSFDSNSYSLLPLSFLRYVAPAAAFSSLALLRVSASNKQVKKIVFVFTLISIVFIIFSTGTNFPGKYIFIPIYNLPYGWLFKEPSRFLLIACISLSIMLAFVIHEICREIFRKKAGQTVLVILTSSLVFIFLSMILVGLPLINGSIVGKNANNKITFYGASHVSLPSYWTSMTAYLNKISHDKILVLPVDDFYQMPYSWGFYGSDAFISDMIDKKIINPNGQGYFPSQAELLSINNSISTELIHHNWNSANKLLYILGTSSLLVRSDLNVDVPGRSFVNPKTLIEALNLDPFVSTKKNIGKLFFYEINLPIPHHSTYVTFNSGEPPIELLKSLPVGTHILNSECIVGIPCVIKILFSNETNEKKYIASSDWHYEFLKSSSYVNTSMIDTPNSPGHTLLDIRHNSNSNSNYVYLYGIPNHEVSDNKTVIVQKTGYSTEWLGPEGSRHLLVDGLYNGWVLNNSNLKNKTISFSGSTPIKLSFLLSIITLFSFISFGIIRCLSSSKSKKN